MSLNIRMTVLGVGLSSAAVGATYFGMNLHSGLEAVPGGLFVAAGVCSGLCIVSSCGAVLCVFSAPESVSLTIRAVIGLSVGKFFLGVAKRGSVMSFANTSQNLADMLVGASLYTAVCEMEVQRFFLVLQACKHLAVGRSWIRSDSSVSRERLGS
jgi:hypothetical protein